MRKHTVVELDYSLPPTEWYDVCLVTGVYHLIQSRIIGTLALLSMSWLWNKKYINTKCILINWINVGENRRVKQSRDTGSNNPEIQGQTIQRYRVKQSRDTGSNNPESNYAEIQASTRNMTKTNKTKTT